MIYTDPPQGERSGYTHDGWDESDSNNVYYYTGEGSEGNQELTRGNKAIFEHEGDGRTLRLFEAVGGRRPGGKRQRYVGAFRLDAERPYRVESAPGRDGRQRQVIVFRMIREDATNTHHPASPMPDGNLRAPSAFPTARHSPGTGLVADSIYASSHSRSVIVELVPSEQNEKLKHETKPSAGVTATRKEAMLVKSFEEHLRADGHDLTRARITVPGETSPLVTDTYDLTEQRLYEAKSAVDRPTVRLGVGQLIDYLRYLPDVRVGALLLPEEPVEDLKLLIEVAGFGYAYPNQGGWAYMMPTSRT